MTTTYTFEQLKADVTKEAQALRVHATAEELGRLVYNDLEPTDARYCIYGLASGKHCYSERAIELMNKCAFAFFDGLPDNYDQLNKFSVEKPNDFIDARRGQFTYHVFSAIEAYILLPEAKNANLIAYLKGETDTLEL